MDLELILVGAAATGVIAGGSILLNLAEESQLKEEKITKKSIAYYGIVGAMFIGMGLGYWALSFQPDETQSIRPEETIESNY